jgi:flagellar biosynthesis protein FlhB
MSEESDKDSKTEEATEKKVNDSIEKGQVPFARELPSLATFIAILVFMLFFVQSGAAHLVDFLSVFLERAHEWELGNAHDAALLQRAVFFEVAGVLGLFMTLLMTAGIAASIVQNVPRFVADRVQPKMSRLSLMKGWQRLFGAQGWVEFGKSLVKMLVVGGFVVFTLRNAQEQLLAGMITQPLAFTSVVRDLAIEVVTAIVVIMVVIAALDLLWSRFHWRQELRMTRQEVKDEIKQSDGDPILKSRIRSIQRDRARNRMMQAVPRATLIIANPTHFSIALRYVREENAAPIVVAKGQDLVALKIREIAAEHGIPVFENVELARSMYKQVSVDSMIPPQFYQAVAELVRVVYSGRKRPAGGPSVQ